MCVISELREQYTRSQMAQRYSSWRTACLSAMCRLSEAFEQRSLPHSWHENSFLGEFPVNWFWSLIVLVFGIGIDI